MSTKLISINKNEIKTLGVVADSLDRKGLYVEASRVDELTRKIVAGNKLNKIKYIVDQLGGWEAVAKGIRELADNYIKKQETKRYKSQQQAQPQIANPVQNLFSQGPEGPSSFIARPATISAMQKEAGIRANLLKVLIPLLLSVSGLSAQQLYDNPEGAVKSIQNQIGQEQDDDGSEIKSMSKKVQQLATVLRIVNPMSLPKAYTDKLPNLKTIGDLRILGEKIGVLNRINPGLGQNLSDALQALGGATDGVLGKYVDQLSKVGNEQNSDRVWVQIVEQMETYLAQSGYR